MSKNASKLFTVIGLLLTIGYVLIDKPNIYGQDRTVPGSPTVKYVQPQILTIEGTDMLCRALWVISEMYLKPITCEGDVLQWDGDIAMDEFLETGGRRISTRGTFVIPEDVKPDKNNGQLNVGVLEKLIEAYQKQYGGPKYKVISSRWGFHVIIDQVRDKNGQFVKVEPYLDTMISVPVGKRIPEEHYAKILDAVNASKDIKLESFTLYNKNLEWLEEEEYVKYLNLPKNTYLVWNEIEELKFEWGITNKVTAREALINLLEQSYTTFSWKVYCFGDQKEGRQICGISPRYLVYNTMELNKQVMGRSLRRDRVVTNKNK